MEQQISLEKAPELGGGEAHDMVGRVVREVGAGGQPTPAASREASRKSKPTPWAGTCKVLPQWGKNGAARARKPPAGGGADGSDGGPGGGHSGQGGNEGSPARPRRSQRADAQHIGCDILATVFGGKGGANNGANSTSFCHLFRPPFIPFQTEGAGTTMTPFSFEDGNRLGRLRIDIRGKAGVGREGRRSA